jgi:DtxR family transcriptional regulator, Mn-dependent transcriptional regulator
MTYYTISPQVEERMREILGNPQTCPHGNPFPGCQYVTSQWIPLTDLPEDVEVTVRRIHEFAEDNSELLKFLIENGIVPGAQIRVTDILPFNQTLTVKTASKPVTLGFASARFIFAEEIER